jgi:hypothetical protein
MPLHYPTNLNKHHFLPCYSGRACSTSDSQRRNSRDYHNVTSPRFLSSDKNSKRTDSSHSTRGLTHVTMQPMHRMISGYECILQITIFRWLLSEDGISNFYSDGIFYKFSAYVALAIYFFSNERPVISDGSHVNKASRPVAYKSYLQVGLSP